MRLSTDTANAAVDVVTARLAGGSLRIYGGDAPDSPDAEPDGPLLVELKWSSPAFPPAQDGMSTSFPLAAAVAVASGNPTVMLAVTPDGAPVFGELVNQGDSTALITPAWIEAGGPVVIDHLVYGGPA